MKPESSPTETSSPANTPRPTTRREFLELSGKATAVSALAGVALPHVHAAEDNTIRLAIVGCGPRGTGAVGNAFETMGVPCKLVAMADLFEDKLDRAYQTLAKQFPQQTDVPPSHRFIGFDAFQQAMDCLRPGRGDIAMLTTRAAFRPTHFEHAVNQGLNVFMEKTFAADPGGIHRLLKTSELADAKGLKVACGLQCRHSRARQAMIQKIRDGAMGDILMIRAYRLQSGGMLKPRQPDPDELFWQIRQSVALLWGSSGIWMENMIHQVDECCWLKDGWPISARGIGGRAPHSPDCSQNFDNYGIEYTFADGAKALVNGRFWPKCENEFATFAHGTKCAGQFSGNIHAPTVLIHQDQHLRRDNVAWQPAKETASPWALEWEDFLQAIRNNEPYNEVPRSAYSNLAGIMGRAACHSGRTITWDEAMASNFFFCPNVDSLKADSEPPVRPDAEGRYPAPVPGRWEEV